MSLSYQGHRYPVEVISHWVWLYHRFPLSFREVEELMLERGVIVSYETVRRWCAKFGQQYAGALRRRQPRPGDKWHLDEVFIKINGEQKYLWRIKPVKRRTQFLEFCRYLRSLYPPDVRIAIISDNFFPHLTTKKCQRVGTWAAANNVELAYTPTDSSWLNRIEAQFTALRYFALDGTDHADHKEQGSMIRRYIIWRNRHADDRRLRAVVDRANVA
ncbi:transposase [Streptomyces sp. NPDC017448]|uniref:transposase n=1 Tax=Streptomyces sp. NPDC017448 TaxID=3364996 RepID=UPI0037BB442F